MAKLFASGSPEMSGRERRNMDRARKLAAQGMVLLENDGTLPLQKQIRTIAAFGSGVRRTVKGGTGSGEVNSRFAVHVEQGLEDAGFTVTTKPWLDRYDLSCKQHYDAWSERMAEALRKEGVDVFAELFANPCRDPDVPEISPEDIRRTRADLAVYVISRISGEGSDRSAAPGDYELSAAERQNLDILTANYEKTVVILNVGGVIDTKYLRGLKGVGAILLMSQAGCAGGRALADVLTGRAAPGGRLAATWAENYGDYPCAKTYSYQNGNLDDEYHTEGIYVGYRYFDTFGVKPAYPFGFGRSYTDFSVQADSVALSGENVVVHMTVANTGSRCSGREVAQVYYSAPAGKLEKPYQELAGFAKTRELTPGETQQLTVSFPIASMASYSEARAAYVLEAGLYYIRVGSHSRSTHIAAALSLDRDVVTRQLVNRVSADEAFPELSAEGAVPYTYEGEAEEKRSAPVIGVDPAVLRAQTAVCSKAPEPLTTQKREPVTFRQIMDGEAALEDLAAQLTVRELAELCVGGTRNGLSAASAICPGAAGETTSGLLDSRGVPNAILADGPAGLRLSRSFAADARGNVIPGLDDPALGGTELFPGGKAGPRPSDAADYYQYCTAIPIATMLAQTWDVDAVEEAGDIVGEEMEELGVTLWLAPGMNIQRNPLCGRNFEYYSEDPLLSGRCAAADTRGVQRHPGRGTTIKHFALNNQESNRFHCNAHCSERAVREIYLRGFEIAVKESRPLALMSSYNLLNGVHTANHFELLTCVLRDEWGFEGMVMSDWGTTHAAASSAGGMKYGCSDPAGCIKAGNDLVMPGRQEDVDGILRALDAGPGEVPCPLTLAELQACAVRVLRMLLRCETGGAHSRV